MTDTHRDISNGEGKRATSLLYQLQDHFRACWKKGDRVSVEDFLKRERKTLGNQDDLLDLIYHEVILREESGETPTLLEYLGRFPALRESLRDLFEVHSALDGETWTSVDQGSGKRDPVLTHRSEPSDPVKPDAVSIPGYELIRELGRGGMGVVYLARQSGLDRLAAVKMILAGEYSRSRDRARFRLEAEALARLDHPNLVKIYEFGEINGRPYFSMEYVDGPRLADSFRGTPIDSSRAATMIETLARASHSAHERGVVHRDLTPNNVLIGSDDRLRIVDFGLSKLITGGMGDTASGDVLGTPSYMAPEQAAGKSKAVGPAADVYALGAILYEALSGRPPFKAESPLDVLVQVVNDDPIAPRRLQPNIPRDLETICLKCLNKEPHWRYASALQLAEDLRRHLDGIAIEARPPDGVSLAIRWARRRPAFASLLTLCASGAVVAFGLITWEGREARKAQAIAENSQLAESRQRAVAEAARASESRQRTLYQGLSARLLRDRALARCEEGDVHRGLLLLARSLLLAPENDQPLQYAIRSNIAAWREQVHPLSALLGHTDRVLAACWSPDGRRVLTATGGAEKLAHLWDAKSGELIGPPLRHPRGINSAGFSPDGRLIFTSAGSEVRLWKTATGEQVSRRSIDLGNGAEFLAQSFSPDSLRLWIAFRERQITWLRGWKTDGLEPIGDRNEIGPGITQVVFRPDAHSFVAVSSNRTIPSSLWTTEPSKLVKKLTAHIQPISSIAFAANDSGTFVSGSLDRTCRLWDASTGEPTGEPFRHAWQIRSVALSPDGRMLLAGGGDGSAQFWDVKKHLASFSVMRHPDSVTTTGFSQDGRLAYTASWDRAYLWDVATGEPVGAPITHTTEVVGTYLSPDGESFLTRSRDSTLRVWRARPERSGNQKLIHRGWVTAVAFKPPSGNTFLTGIGGTDARVRLWSASPKTQEGETIEGFGPVLSLAYSRDGQMFAVGSVDHEVSLFRESELPRKPIHKLKLADRVWSVAFSPDGKTLLAGIERRRGEFWDVATGKPKPPALAHEKAVYAVDYSPDGRWVLTGSEDTTAKLWDAETHRHNGITLRHNGTVYAAAFRPPDGRVVVTGSGDRTARLWDAKTGQPIGEPLDHPARVLAVAFSPDGRVLATGCGDGVCRLWDAETGHPIGRSIHHRAPVRSVAFAHGPLDLSNSGTRLSAFLTGSQDHTAQLGEILPPVSGSPQQILESLMLVIGMSLDAQDFFEPISPDRWKKLLLGTDPG